jgi:hypothetical protein
MEKAMPRKSSTQPKEPATLPEVLIPPSEAADNERSAYWLQLIQEPDQFKAAIATEDFFPMLQEFPAALWERLSIYLYRLTDDRGMMIRNAANQKGYLPGGVLHHAFQEEDVVRSWGGGKFRAYLKLDSKTTLREHVFYIDAPPKVLTGQVVEIQGKEVPVGNAPPPPSDEGSAISKVIDANTKANESAMGILAHASETAIDMVKAQSVAAANPPQQENALDTAIKLIELLRPQAPTTDPVQAKLMEKIIDKAFAEPTAPPEPEHRETKLEEVSEFVRTITGKDLSDLTRGRTSNPETEYAWVPAASNFGIALLAKIPDIIRELRVTKDIEFQRALYLRSLPQGQVPQNQLPLPPMQTDQPAAPAQPQPPAAPAAPATPTKEQIIQAIVASICTGFDKHRDTGEDVAAAISVNFGEFIESMGLEPLLTNQEQMMGALMAQPALAAALAERSAHAKWNSFIEPFADYMAERWGETEPEEPPKTGPQSVA